MDTNGCRLLMNDRRLQGNTQHPLYIEFKDAMDAVRVRAREMVAEAREAAVSADEGNPLRNSYFSRLLARGELDASEAERELVNLMFAGVDTTTHVLMWLVFHLARNPEKQQKLREELMEELGANGDLTLQSLTGLRYLDGCVRESHRLTPATIGGTPFCLRMVVLVYALMCVRTMYMCECLCL